MLLTGLSACTGDDPEIERYVALGDSFAAGSGLEEPVPETGPCAQSYLSYPYLVAAELDAELADATCGGATTEHATQPQLRAGQSPWPPQLDSVTRDTDLVTVALGYNDLSFYAEVLLGCTLAAADQPGGAPCRSRGPGDARDLRPLPAQIGQRVQRLLEKVQEAAPDAEVLVVGYPQPVPESGTCPELPLAPGDYPFVHDLLVDLDDALREAADAAGARFVDVMAASEGHDICAGADAWVAGLHPGPGIGVGYHPFDRWQAAVADLVLEELEG